MRARVEPVRRSCSCGGRGVGSRTSCQCKLSSVDSRQRALEEVPSVLTARGESLRNPDRAFMERRFGRDLGSTRIHVDPAAVKSARSLGAAAYTVGNHVVFDANRYPPRTQADQALLAHELVHVLQQDTGNTRPRAASLAVSEDHEREADRVAERVADRGQQPGRVGVSHVTEAPILQGQFPGSRRRLGEAIERDIEERKRPSQKPGPLEVAGTTAQFRVCSRPTQGFISISGAHHAYIQTPTRRYAVLTPLCTPNDDGPNDVIRGTAAQTWQNSPDPCGQSPVPCVACEPRPGVTDLESCFARAFAAYPSPGLYKGAGPNSNTFAGSLARACCQAMDTPPPELAWLPGWSSAAASPRPAACPPGPASCV
jgi:Domain of unknown function (DUF4157)